MEKLNETVTSDEIETNDGWMKPEILSFAPVEVAEGISYNPSDGLANLTL
jgi:hypothetical protein